MFSASANRLLLVADPSQSGYVLSPHGRLDIQGWRRSLSQTAALYFTSLADSYAGRTGRPDQAPHPQPFPGFVPDPAG